MNTRLYDTIDHYNIDGTEEVSILGWYVWKGEVEIYRDREMIERTARYPDCISGIFRIRPSDVEKFNGQLVQIRGRPVEYSSLPREADRPLARRMLNEQIVSNFCFGTYVIDIDSIEVAP